jgi:hypothetical protein
MGVTCSSSPVAAPPTAIPPPGCSDAGQQVVDIPMPSLTKEEPIDEGPPRQSESCLSMDAPVNSCTLCPPDEQSYISLITEELPSRAPHRRRLQKKKPSPRSNPRENNWKSVLTGPVDDGKEWARKDHNLPFAPLNLMRRTSSPTSTATCQTTTPSSIATTPINADINISPAARENWSREYPHRSHRARSLSSEARSVTFLIADDDYLAALHRANDAFSDY